MFVCYGAHMCAVVYACERECAWRPEDHLECRSSSTLFETSLSLAWKLPIWLGRLSRVTRQLPASAAPTLEL